MSRLPDEVGQRLVEGPVVLRDLCSVIGSGAVMIYISAGCGGSGRGRLHRSLSEMTRLSCSRKVQCDTKPAICHPVNGRFFPL